MPTTNFTDANGNLVTLNYTSGPGGVPFIEHLGYRESFTNAGQQEATRVLSCLWSDKHKFRADMLGYSSWSPGNEVGGIQCNMSRVLPDQFPDPDLNYLWASEIMEGEGMGVPVQDDSNLAKALSSAPRYTGIGSGSSGNQTVTDATVVNGGAGYQANDILTVNGGATSNPAQLTVAGVSSGVVSSVTVSTGGTYTSLPGNPVSVEGGFGSGATFNLTGGSAGGGGGPNPPVQSCMMDPVTGAIVFNLYTCKVAYRWKPFRLYSDTDVPGPDQGQPFRGELTRFVEKRTALSVDSLPIGLLALYFAGTQGSDGNNERVPEAGVAQLGSMTLLYRWYEVPYFEAALYNMLPSLGKINSTIFGGVYPIGTCLFTSVETERIYPNAQGKLTADLCLHFAYRNQGGMVSSGSGPAKAKGWNYFLRPSAKPPAWYQAIYDPKAGVQMEPMSDGAAVFNYADFNALFTLPAAAVPNAPPP